jgi:hypothetical protein
LQRQVAANIKGNGEIEVQKLAKRRKRVEIVQRWLSNSSQDHQIGINEHQTEHLGSSNWFLELAKYRNWKNRKFDQHHANDSKALRAGWHDRVLFVQGKEYLVVLL